MNSDYLRVNWRELRKNCSPSQFKFNSTADVPALKGVIGQKRAEAALSTALDINIQGYNIYLAGEAGMGKNTLAKAMLEKKASREPVPLDWCYVYNFANPGVPAALSVPAGIGKKLKQSLSAAIDRLMADLIDAFVSEDFSMQKNEILNDLLTETNNMYLELDHEARGYGFTVTQSQSGVQMLPINKNGEVMGQDEYAAMSEQDRAEMLANNALVQEKMNYAIRKYQHREKVFKDKVKTLEQETARIACEPHFNTLLSEFNKFPEIVEYIQTIQKDLLENYELLVKPPDNIALSLFRQMDKKAFLRRYQVNLLVDNSENHHAPVVFENNPTFANLFGQIEYEGEFGILSTDFSKIRAGSVHRANGGYLVLQAYDLLKNFYVWDTLKRLIKNQEISIENISRTIGLTNTETLEPQPIPLNFKVILIGDPGYYYLLYHHDEEFRKLFKIRADFTDEMDRSRRHVNDYARFISSVCVSQKLRHFTPDAVARMVDYGCRMADDQQKLSASFNKLMEIICEADCLARQDKQELVNGQHVQQAIEQKIYRCSMVEEKLQEAMNRQVLMINVEGEKVGEVNALAVYQVGEHRFARPVRITAKTYMGEKGVVNIEREVLLSGNIHSKGVLTLGGYLGAQYAQDKPLTLSGSITFEQSYQGVDGDSASSAELYAMISSLSGIPIRQGIAVTGSVNQNGEIQAVGGVNEKIEGFFKVCQERGLNGNQGVIIPAQNVVNLMLEEEIIAAVRSRKFTIYAIHHIDEGLEILTGRDAGKKDEYHRFAPETVHYLANEQLEEWSRRKIAIHKSTGPNSRKKSPVGGRRRRRK